MICTVMYFYVEVVPDPYIQCSILNKRDYYHASQGVREDVEAPESTEGLGIGYSRYAFEQGSQPSPAS